MSCKPVVGDGLSGVGLCLDSNQVVVKAAIETGVADWGGCCDRPSSAFEAV